MNVWDSPKYIGLKIKSRLARAAVVFDLPTSLITPYRLNTPKPAMTSVDSLRAMNDMPVGMQNRAPQ
jgi:hypothetical protein